MSKHETAMTIAYWEHVGRGTLVEEFRVVPPGPDHGHRDIDGIILLGGDFRRLTPKEKLTIKLRGEDVIVVQTKVVVWECPCSVRPYSAGTLSIALGQSVLRPSPFASGMILYLSPSPSDMKSM